MFKPFVSVLVGLAVVLAARCVSAGKVSVMDLRENAVFPSRRVFLPKVGRPLRTQLHARKTAGPDTKEAAALPHGELDFGEATILADRLPAEVVKARQSTATAGVLCGVRGSLRLDPEAKFTPSSVWIGIVFTKANGGKVFANSAIGKLTPEPGQDRLYQFETAMKAPLRPGSYEIIARYRGQTFSSGRLEVSE